MRASSGHATLLMIGRLVVNEGLGKQGVPVVLALGERFLPLAVHKEPLEDLPKGSNPICTLTLKPRTDDSGVLSFGTELVRARRAVEEEGISAFQVLGTLVGVNRDEAWFRLELPARVHEPVSATFELTLNSSLALLDRLPEEGRQVEAWGELKLRSGRLMATTARALQSPP